MCPVRINRSEYPCLPQDSRRISSFLPQILASDASRVGNDLCGAMDRARATYAMYTPERTASRNAPKVGQMVGLSWELRLFDFPGLRNEVISSGSWCQETILSSPFFLKLQHAAGIEYPALTTSAATFPDWRAICQLDSYMPSSVRTHDSSLRSWPFVNSCMQVHT